MMCTCEFICENPVCTCSCHRGQRFDFDTLCWGGVETHEVHECDGCDFIRRVLSLACRQGHHVKLATVSFGGVS